MVRPMILGYLGLTIGSLLVAGTAFSAGAFDGTYIGSRRQTEDNNSSGCQNLSRDHARLVVKDNVASYTWATGPIVGTVQSDGSFEGYKQGLATRGASPMFSLKGKITGTKLEADVGSTQCAVHLSLTKG